MLDLPQEVRLQIADHIEREKLIGAIKLLREAHGNNLGLKEAKDVIDGLVRLSHEDRSEILEGSPQLPNENFADTTPTSDIATHQSNEIATQLKMLADLHASGALSDEEFTAAKNRLLS